MRCERPNYKDFEVKAYCYEDIAQRFMKLDLKNIWDKQNHITVEYKKVNSIKKNLGSNINIPLQPHHQLGSDFVAQLTSTSENRLKTKERQAIEEQLITFQNI